MFFSSAVSFMLHVVEERPVLNLKSKNAVNAIKAKAVPAFILVFYLLSLLPSTKAIVINELPELSHIVLQMQQLESEAYNSSSYFPTTFQKTVDALKSYAGLQSLIFHKRANSESEQNILIAFTFRLPYVLNNIFILSPPEPTDECKISFLNPNYTSLTILPELPPPITS